MKNFVCKLLLLMLIFCASKVNAEIRNYTGVGEYIMSEFETLDIAKQRAKQKAERAAQEQAGVFVNSYTKVNNHQVMADEVITITGGILNVIDVHYKLTPLEDGKSVLISATVNVTIDTADVDKWLEKSVAQRSQLVEQNEALRRANAEQDRQIAELKKQLADIKTQQDMRHIANKIAAEEKIFLSNLKIGVAISTDNHGNYNGVIRLSNQAAELTPNVEFAYKNRGNNIYDNRGNAYTGVVIDASGLGLATTFSPVIYDTRGREIYGIKNLDEEIVMNIGMVSYSTSTNDATIKSRAGSNPLFVRAVKVRGGNNSANKVNAVISVEDANKILQANRKTHVLDRCAVVFVK